MNERIKLLAIEAGGHGMRMSTIGLSLLGPDCIDKFAELLIKECAKRSEELGQPELGKGLMKHFGVEE